MGKSGLKGAGPGYTGLHGLILGCTGFYWFLLCSGRFDWVDASFRRCVAPPLHVSASVFIFVYGENEEKNKTNEEPSSFCWSLAKRKPSAERVYDGGGGGGGGVGVCVGVLPLTIRAITGFHCRHHTRLDDVFTVFFLLNLIGSALSLRTPQWRAGGFLCDFDRCAS